MESINKLSNMNAEVEYLSPWTRSVEEILKKQDGENVLGQ